MKPKPKNSFEQTKIESIHVTPLNDLKKHSEDFGCECKPKMVPENGVWIVVHNSFDGREVMEKDFAGIKQ